MSLKYSKFATMRTALAAVASSFALVLSACGGGAGTGNGSSGGDEGASSAGWAPYEAEPGSDIPTETVKFGMRPYADNTFWQIGVEEGWFDDVGIEFDGGKPISTTEDQWINLLINGDVDVNTNTCAIMVTSYATTDELKCIQHAVTFFGQVMFAKADLGLKSVQDYIDEGQSFDEALKLALEPMVGKDVYIPPGTGEITFTQTPFEVAGLDLPNYKPTEDSDMFTQAQAGQIDFLHPGGAPIAVELLKLGWKPIYDTRQIVDNGPVGADSPFAGLVLNNGIGASASYALEHQDTILRFVSVMYRIAAETGADPGLFDIQAPYLNSVAGTNLTGQEIADLFAELHPLELFEEATEYYEDSSSAQYYSSIGQAIIDDQVDAGAIPEGITPDDFIWAADIYADMKKFKEQYDEILAGDTSGGDADLLTQAAEQYENYNFLDAYRLAAAATA